MTDFTYKDYLNIQEKEAIVRHDVKAIEYFIKELPEIKEGDILCFHNAGAYGYTMASNYNSRPRPAEALFMDGGLHLIRRKETLEDILQTQVELEFLK